MPDSEETYCRLCAEPTSTDALISPDDAVGQNSKIRKKMLWINVDVSSSSELPKSICFSCFDALERSWKFLQTVRTAQEKLSSIFKVEKPTEKSLDTGKPVDSNWETFQSPDTKVKNESSNNVKELSLRISLDVKCEPSDSDNFIDNLSSTDSETPLTELAQKKPNRTKKKKQKNYDEECLELDLATNNTVEVLDMSAYTMTWDDYTWCCGKCDAQCKSIELLRLHSLEIHNSCCSIKCTDCNKVNATYQIFLSHIRWHYKSLRYHCDICNEYFNLLVLMKKHRQSAHRSVLQYVCKSCGMNFDNRDALTNHYLLYNKSKRNTKKIIESEERELKCSLCDKKFKSRSNLMAHKLLHTERSKDYSCHMCGKMFYTKGSLSTHMNTHEETKKYKCEYCSMTFRARGNLSSHMSLHSGVKPYVCEQCGKSFRVKRLLKSHSIVHTDLMPYVCGYCNKSFRFKTRLNLHIRQHTGVKPYTCEFCNRNFTNGSNHKKHMKRRHNLDLSLKKKLNNSNVVIEVVKSEENAETQNS